MSYTDVVQTPLTLRGLTLGNRIVIPPMCMWIADPDKPGVATDEHLVHYGTLAEDGVGLVIVEATAVQACGPISPMDLGIWGDQHIEGLKRITDYIHKTPAKVSIQLAHAGRKGITLEPMSAKPIHLKPTDRYGLQCVAPSAIPHDPEYMLTPHELTLEEIEQLKADWVSAAKRAVAAGFDAIEIHGAHGYLLNEFTSPISNKRTDKYGGSAENRLRLPLEIVEMVRAVIPDTMPLSVRISCVDWDPEGVQLEDSIRYSTELGKRGVDVIHCSSGGVSYKQKVDMMHSDYQIRFAEEIKEKTGCKTIAVGNVKTYDHAKEILDHKQADLVAIGRAVLADPMWYRNALVAHGVTPWVPAREIMGFHKSKRRQEAEKKAATSAAAQKGSDAAGSPAKLSAIRWPQKFTPGTTDNFVHNEIIVPKLTADAVWKTLLNTSGWTKLYGNVSDVSFKNNAGPLLTESSCFSFKTFGLPIEAEITEWVPPASGTAARIAWHGWMEPSKPGQERPIDVLHAWLFEDLEGGRVRIVTEESQCGPQARDMAAEKPNPMLNAHQDWIEGLAKGAMAS